MGKFNFGSHTSIITTTVHHYAHNLRTTESVFLKLYIVKFYEQFVQPLQLSFRSDNSNVHSSLRTTEVPVCFWNVIR